MKNFNGDSTAFEAVFKEHIQTITSRFKDYTTSWDVVNEAIADNDYSLESDSLKRNKALKMIADFQKQAVPLDGIGLQMHILIDKPSLKEN